MMNDNTMDQILEWLANGETGLSSKSIVNFLVFGKLDNLNHPRDPADLRRCQLLLKRIPVIDQEFKVRMGSVSPEWQILVTHWDQLTESLNQEIKATDGRSASETYSLMKSLLAKARV